MSDSDSNTLSVIFQYFSKSIVPMLIPLFLAGLFFIWTARSDVSHAQKDIDRIATEHNGRIMANQISIRELNSKVARIEVSVTQILQGISATQKDMKAMTRNISKINGSILVLLDRDERRDISTHGTDSGN